MKILIQTIPHKQQRLRTSGDWWWERDGSLQIRVSKMSDGRFEVLVAVHELVEVLLCKHDRVSQRSVDRFDIAFERARKAGNVDEPGDDHRAPYRKQHCVATGIERIMAALLGVDWNKYAAEVERLA
jgi:hypothetical protein